MREERKKKHKQKCYDIEIGIRCTDECVGTLQLVFIYELFGTVSTRDVNLFVVSFLLQQKMDDS